MTVRAGLYRFFQRRIVGPLAARRRGPAFDPAAPLPPPSSRRRGWFHAASAGELESLWPVIAAWASRGGECVVTAFSPSARPGLERLGRELAPGSLLFAGNSPWEGGWDEAFSRVRPAVFATAKYEAWPELWMALAAREIPLVIVGARARRSLRVARALCLVLGSPLPRLHLLAAGEGDVAPLERLLPGARIAVTGDPRWDRVRERASRGNRRAEELVAACALAVPAGLRGILGQTWLSDLDAFGPALAEASGTLWVVPHELGEREVASQAARLVGAGLEPVRTSGRAPAEVAAELARADGRRRCVLVDEMGFLSELYAGADWAYVGGGFGASVHSTIEPAIRGIPIAIGPSGADRFPEIDELARTGQLRILVDGAAARVWLAGARAATRDDRERWTRLANQRFGATERVLSAFPPA